MRLSALLRRKLQEVNREQAPFYLTVSDENLKLASNTTPYTILEMLRVEEVRVEYFKVSTLRITKIVGDLFSVVDDLNRSFTIDVERRKLIAGNAELEILSMQEEGGNLIVEINYPLLSKEMFDAYQEYASKVDFYRNIDRNAFNLIVNIGGLSGSDLLSLCSVDTKINGWCDNQFYHNAIRREFPGVVEDEMEPIVRYKDMYTDLWQGEWYIFKGKNDSTLYWEKSPYDLRPFKHYILFDDENVLIFSIKPYKILIGLTYSGRIVVQFKFDLNNASQNIHTVNTLINNPEYIRLVNNFPDQDIFANAKDMYYDVRSRMLYIVTEKGKIYRHTVCLLPKTQRGADLCSWENLDSYDDVNAKQALIPIQYHPALMDPLLVLDDEGSLFINNKLVVYKELKDIKILEPMYTDQSDIFYLAQTKSDELFYLQTKRRFSNEDPTHGLESVKDGQEPITDVLTIGDFYYVTRRGFFNSKVTIVKFFYVDKSYNLWICTVSPEGQHPVEREKLLNLKKLSSFSNPRVTSVFFLENGSESRKTSNIVVNFKGENSKLLDVTASFGLNTDNRLSYFYRTQNFPGLITAVNPSLLGGDQVKIVTKDPYFMSAMKLPLRNFV